MLRPAIKDPTMEWKPSSSDTAASITTRAKENLTIMAKMLVNVFLAIGIATKALTHTGISWVLILRIEVQMIFLGAGKDKYIRILPIKSILKQY